MTHTFSICAYKESPYLEECIRSVVNQESRVIMCTSTPNGYISGLADKYGIELFVRDGQSNIADDWNFALSCADTDLVTLAHQDDVYAANYASVMMDRMSACKNPILFSSNYGEIRNGKRVYSNRLLNIKKVLRIPMRLAKGSKKARRMSLAFGSSICCPSVTYVKDIITACPFVKGFKADLDWQKWEELSRLEGEFAFSNEYLMFHRIHEESETSRVIGETGRDVEDYEMFRKFWPEKIARALTKKYKSAEESNKVK